MKRVIIIGGGAAGMMAAYAAAKTLKAVNSKENCEECEILLLEQNEKLGKKVFITGKGRCNVTNACETEELFRNIVNNEKFMYSAFYGFDNRAVMDFFEESGCPLKVERGDRVFPVSDHSSDIIAALTRKLMEEKVCINLHTKITDVLTEDGKITGVILEDGTRKEAAAVIVATGGISYPSTGSTGDGYRLAGKTGHKIIPPLPALIPFMVKEDWCKELQGLSLKNVSVSLKEGKKELYSGFGEMLFTHFGVSGPLILSAGSMYSRRLRNTKAGSTGADNPPVRLLIDLKPALSAQQLDKRLLRDFEEYKNKQFKNSLGGLFPAKLIPVMLRLSEIAPEKKVNEISREERRQFAAKIKNLPLTITGTRPVEEAIVTMGGVDVKEINPSTMESKRIKGLFFAGEVLDVDAFTGGFNLQIAWSTGYLAGENAGKEIKDEL